MNRIDAALLVVTEIHAGISKVLEDTDKSLEELRQISMIK